MVKKKKYFELAVWGFAILLIAAGCGSSSNDSGSSIPAQSSENDPAPSPTPAPPSEEDGSAGNPPRVTFGEVNRKILIPKCIECHGASGGVNLESYERVKSELPMIERAVLIERSMPPMEAEPLTDQERQMLKEWIELGAP